MWTAFIFSIIVAATAAHTFPPVNLPTTCLTKLCPVGTTCTETNEGGVVQARCVGGSTPIEKEGLCPSIDQLAGSEAGLEGICTDACRLDIDCKGSDKCCKNPCGALSCQKPWDPRPSCGSMKCGLGQECVLQKVQCVRAPCHPVPVCVDRKPGVCPKPGPFDLGTCASTCFSDGDCEGSHKCCKNGCGATTCRAAQGLFPDPSELSCDTVDCGLGEKCVMQEVHCIRAPCNPVPVCVKDAKPGRCRKPSPFDVGICASTCKTDSDCDGSDKCCENGCGASTCQAPEGLVPDVIKPVTCDTVRCGAGKKCVMKEFWCIRAPCPSPRPVCVPIKDKPGVCPKPRFSFCYIGRHQCQTDSECPDAQKCCKTRCGARCQDPRPQPTRTCATVDCRPDEICEMRVRCDKLGCFPRPTCEPVKRCPFYPAWINPDCVPHDTCSEKEPNSCSPGTICCATDCGRHCVRPME